MKKIIFLIAILAIVPVFVGATIDEVSPIFQAYREQVSVGPFDINVPTVVEIGIDGIDSVTRKNFGVRGSDGIFLPWLFSENFLESEKTFSASSAGSALYEITDDDYSTYSTFELPQDSQGEVSIYLKSSAPVRSNRLNIALDQYVSLPTALSISYYDAQGGKKVILSNVKPISSSINFPETVSDRWLVDLTYSQPLRIVEMSLNDLDFRTESGSGLRFLAKPGVTYTIYLNPDRYVDIKTGESPNLSKNEGVMRVGASQVVPNVLYVKADIDSDGVADELDNCVNIANTDQLDVDGNKRGDACDDFDRDGIINSKDNCVNEPNRSQEDIDDDGIGDSCDGEESRITEKYPALVWGGISFAVIIFILLYFVAIRSMQEQKKKEGEEDIETPTSDI